MPKYCVNTNAQYNKSGTEYEVHRLDKEGLHGDNQFPQGKNQKPLGEHSSCAEAIRAAEKALRDAGINMQGKKVDGCAICCDEKHTPDIR